jgi:hypothetical protein
MEGDDRGLKAVVFGVLKKSAAQLSRKFENYLPGEAACPAIVKKSNDAEVQSLQQIPPSMVRIRFSYRALYYQAKLQSGCLTVETDRAKHPELTVHNRIVPAPSAPDLRSTWARVNGLKTFSFFHGD